MKNLTYIIAKIHFAKGLITEIKEFEVIIENETKIVVKDADLTLVYKNQNYQYSHNLNEVKIENMIEAEFDIKAELYCDFDTQRAIKVVQQSLFDYYNKKVNHFQKLLNFTTDKV